MRRRLTRSRSLSPMAGQAICNCRRRTSESRARVIIMSTGTIANTTTTDEAARSRYPRRQTVLIWGSVFALFVVAVGMRLYELGLPFDRDGYDEGVYWQSLLAM